MAVFAELNSTKGNILDLLKIMENVGPTKEGQTFDYWSCKIGGVEKKLSELTDIDIAQMTANVVFVPHFKNAE